MMLRKLRQSIECFPMDNADISFKMLNSVPMGSNNLGFFPVSSNSSHFRNNQHDRLCLCTVLAIVSIS